MQFLFNLMILPNTSIPGIVNNITYSITLKPDCSCSCSSCLKQRDSPWDDALMQKVGFHLHEQTS